MKEWFENKDIAIVGGASGLFTSFYGEKIDSHEVVIRLNRGIIIKDKKHQGTKTNYWAYPHPLKLTDIRNKFNCKTIHLQDIYREQEPKSDFYLPTKIIDELYERKTQYGKSKTKAITDKPSSGLMLLYYLTKCETKEISLYGFDWKKTSTWYDHKQSRTVDHNWETEEKFVKNDLLSHHNIRILEHKKTDYVFEDSFYGKTKL